MEANDYWTHIGLVTTFFVIVVGPRLFSPGHAVNSMIFIVGATVLIAVATVARYRTKSADSRTLPTWVGTRRDDDHAPRGSTAGRE